MDRLHSRSALLAAGLAMLTAAAAYLAVFALGRLRFGPESAPVREFVKEETVSLSCAVIREEAALVSSRQWICPTVGDGVRLAAGEAAAIAYDDAGEYMRAALLLRLTRELRALECASSAPAPGEVLSQRRAALSAALVRGDYDGANAFSNELALGLLSSAADSGRALALREEIAALETAGAGAFLLTAPRGAVYSSYTDGWEALSPGRLRELDPGLLEAVISAPVLAPSAAGKLVTGSAFLLSGLTDSSSGALFPPGDVFELRTAAGCFSGEVILLRTDEDHAAVIFRCQEAVERVLNDRVLTVEVLLDRTAGLLLPKAALHRDGDSFFVYRIAGEVLLRTDVMPLAETPEGILVSSDALRPGDHVLLDDAENSGIPVF